MADDFIDLYAELGIGWNATAEEIRAAYRRLAKTAHPDAGGSRERWERLKLAHDVLTDEEARTRYDCSGKIVRPAAEKNPDAEAAAMIAAAFAEVIDRLQRNERKIDRADLLDLVRQMIEANDGERHGQIRDAAEVVQAFDGKFRRLSDGPNYLQGVVDQHRQRLDGMKARSAELDAVSARARALLADFRFDLPPVLTHRDDAGWQRLMQGGLADMRKRAGY